MNCQFKGHAGIKINTIDSHYHRKKSYWKVFQVQATGIWTDTAACGNILLIIFTTMIIYIQAVPCDGMQRRIL